ncbi:ABC transporter ATP-binding protein [Companilactobacillus huachuanensis]|uniref:ABC transporter ATP-binding protein n=1 Tax=Companilactobacillus huachuanensis TaxID=2559914 RepID=A0ABW1RQ39_9LACO|nr:ABC transporter ATP-binding protein [Companilactobacillus huachuanensis]
MTSIVTVEHLNKNYGKKEILHNINFTVNKSQIIALIGENGAGKTTLINILLDLISSNSGTVNILDNEKNFKERIGVMMQQNISITRITVKEILKLTQSYYQSPLAYEKIIELSDLYDLEDSKMDKLSGGQKRRLSFALAIAGNPDLLFLDEPTAGMDSQSRTKFWQTITDLKEQHKTVFVTSHYLEELETIADRIMILQNKSISFDGSIAQLRVLEGESMIEFDSKLLPNLFKDMPEIIDFKKVGDHYKFTTKNAELIIGQLTPYLNAINNLKVQQNSLDSLFVNFNKEGATHE